MKRLAQLSLGVFLCFATATLAYAQGSEKIVESVDVQGVVTVNKDKVIAKIKTRPYQPYIETVVSEDIKRIYSLGFFDDITVSIKKTLKPKYIDVIFEVKEKAILEKITFKGNRKLKSHRLNKQLELKTGSFIDEFQLKEARDVLWGFYVKKGYPEVDISSELSVDPKTNKASATFTINEKGSMRISDIFVKGNIAFSDKQIKKLLKTKSKWLFNAGIYKKDVMDDDIARVRDFYRSKGFADVEVDVDIEKRAAKGRMSITFDVKEGKRYLVGTIAMEGIDKYSEQKIWDYVSLKKGDIYNEIELIKIVGDITEHYFDDGYIFTQVTPLSYVNPDNNLVDITFKIEESDLVNVRLVHIRGNVRTREKVIRRELRIHPGDAFEGSKIRRSKENLENLGYFEDVTFEPESFGQEDEQDLVVSLKETKTGSFSFGGGYSSVDKFVGFVELRQRNFDWKNWPYFTGAGQDLSLKLQLGSTVSEYSLSFTEPWMFDKPVSFGFDVFSSVHDNESSTGYDYQESRKGGRLRLGKRFSDEFNMGTSYKFEKIDISDVDDNASAELKAEVGSTKLSVWGAGLNYDTRDSVLVPTKGILTGIHFDWGGGPLGGDVDFTRTTMMFNWYHGFISDSIFEARFSSGWAEPNKKTDELPIYERFFAGGASSIRGYHERKVGPIGDEDNEPLGGRSKFVMNLEVTKPLGDMLKVATFFDAGNVWKKQTDWMSSKLFKSVGMGLRVKTPLGPISIDYGYPLDKEPGEDKKSGRVHFNMSRGF